MKPQTKEKIHTVSKELKGGLTYRKDELDKCPIRTRWFTPSENLPDREELAQLFTYANPTMQLFTAMQTGDNPYTTMCTTLVLKDSGVIWEEHNALTRVSIFTALPESTRKQAHYVEIGRTDWTDENGREWLIIENEITQLLPTAYFSYCGAPIGYFEMPKHARLDECATTALKADPTLEGVIMTKDGIPGTRLVFAQFKEVGGMEARQRFTLQSIAEELSGRFIEKYDRRRWEMDNTGQQSLIIEGQINLM